MGLGGSGESLGSEGSSRTGNREALGMGGGCWGRSPQAGPYGVSARVLDMVVVPGQFLPPLWAPPSHAVEAPQALPDSLRGLWLTQAGPEQTVGSCACSLPCVWLPWGPPWASDVAVCLDWAGQGCEMIRDKTPQAQRTFSHGGDPGQPWTTAEVPATGGQGSNVLPLCCPFLGCPGCRWPGFHTRGPSACQEEEPGLPCLNSEVQKGPGGGAASG